MKSSDTLEWMCFETDVIGSALYSSLVKRLLNRAMSCNLKTHSTLQNNAQNELRMLYLDVLSHLLISQLHKYRDNFIRSITHKDMPWEGLQPTVLKTQTECLPFTVSHSGKARKRMTGIMWWGKHPYITEMKCKGL